MSSNCYEINGHKYKRSIRQGRRPSGLGKLRKYRLYSKDEERLEIIKKNLGYLYNENEIIRTALKIYLDNFVPTELLIQ